MIKRALATALLLLSLVGMASTAPATLGLADVTLGQNPGTAATDLYLGHAVNLDVGGNAGELVVILLSLTPPGSNPPLINGVPLAVDPFAFVTITSSFLVIPGSGSLSLPATIPSNVPAGIEIWTQAGLIDPVTSVPRLTNGLHLTTRNEPFATIDQGEHCGHPLGVTGGSLIITDATSWAAFWAQHVSGIPGPPPLPIVDFNKHAVLAQFMGQQVITGILFSIEKVVFDGAGLQIDVLTDLPGAGCTFPPGSTCPFHIVTVAKPVALSVSVLSATVTFYSCP